MDEKTLQKLEYNKIIQKLTSCATSSLGKELAEELLPSTDTATVHQMLHETSDAVSMILQRGSPPLGGVHDIRASIKRVELGGVLNPGELLKISDVLRACRNLKNYASDDRGINKDNMASALMDSLQTNRTIEEKISKAVLNEDELSDNASTTLYNIRRQMRSLQDSIKDKLNAILKSSKYQKYMQEAIVTMREDRYVIPVKQEYREDFPGLIHDASSSGATIFIEPLAVVQANNSIKQLKIKEQGEIERILIELTQDVAGIIESLGSNVSILAKLDFIFAKAKLSLDYKCTCPKANKEKQILLKKARHPLIDQKVVVPIDFWLGDKAQDNSNCNDNGNSKTTTLVITGPNTGGKTVTLKTVGLLTLMAQAGLHIPCGDGTVVHVFGSIFADIGDEQSIEQSLSTFSSHMRNIVEMLKSAGSDLLMLFDELGAGTDPTEGAALAMAILEHLRAADAVTVATTHYSELKLYAAATDGVENACCEFDVETLKPTYNLLIGIPGKSNAFAISKRLGLPELIIDKAKEFLSREDIKFEDVLMTIEKNLSESKDEKMKAESLRWEIEKLRDDLEKQKQNMDAQKEKIIKEAKQEALKILDEAKNESDKIISRMNEKLDEISDEYDASISKKEINKLNQELRSRSNDLERELVEPLIPKKDLQKFSNPPKNLKVGDSVLIVSLNQKGSVLTLPDKNGEVLLQVGIMKINIPVVDLRIIEDTKSHVYNKDGGMKIGASKAKSIALELDVRGFMREDAVDTVDKYIDDAALSGVTQVTIIHGKGTGVLRSSIHAFLKGHPHVKAFRLGTFGEGEMGVTVVQIA